MKVRLGVLVFLFLLVLFPVSVFASTWAKSYGDSKSELPTCIRQTSDGGFIMTGSTDSYGAGILGIPVLKLDATGNIAW